MKKLVVKDIFIKNRTENAILYNFVESIVKIAIFLGYFYGKIAHSRTAIVFRYEKCNLFLDLLKKDCNLDS